MIEQDSKLLKYNICFNCEQDIKINQPNYTIADMVGSNIRTFPNGKPKLIVFCHPCWDLIAGKRYTFSKEAPLPKDYIGISIKDIEY